jgi:hypothetical protein
MIKFWTGVFDAILGGFTEATIRSEIFQQFKELVVFGTGAPISAPLCNEDFGEVKLEVVCDQQAGEVGEAGEA